MLRVLREVSRISRAVRGTVDVARSELERRWKKYRRRSWLVKTAWPWVRYEARVILRITVVIVVSIWARRLVEQWFGTQIISEFIYRGHVNDVMREVEDNLREEMA